MGGVIPFLSCYVNPSQEQKSEGWTMLQMLHWSMSSTPSGTNSVPNGLSLRASRYTYSRMSLPVSIVCNSQNIDRESSRIPHRSESPPLDLWWETPLTRFMNKWCTYKDSEQYLESTAVDLWYILVMSQLGQSQLCSNLNDAHFFSANPPFILGCLK